jgi:hypothetical protein
MLVIVDLQLVVGKLKDTQPHPSFGGINPPLPPGKDKLTVDGALGTAEPSNKHPTRHP